MRDVILVRKYGSMATTGQLYVDHKPFCKTWELPWLDNKKLISCIPPGAYRVIYNYSKRFKKNMYLLTNVPGRVGIRIHAGLKSEGCILLGENFSVLNGVVSVTDGLLAKKRFEDAMERLGFVLHVV